MRRRMIIDTDTGSDDAVALVMALRSLEVEVEAITLVAGNVPVDQGLQNALYTVELCAADVPVHRGVEKPLLRPLETAQFVHGDDGMGDIGLPLEGRRPAPGHAVDVLVERLGDAQDAPILVCLGPLTNVAVALLRAPALARSVASCIVMGGTAHPPGNVTPVAEYNVWADPEAAKIVFESQMPITMVGWDQSHRVATVDPELEAELRSLGTELSRFAMDIQCRVGEFARRHTKLAGFDLPDPLAMAVALDPKIATTVPRHVEVIGGDGPTRGQTVVDHLGSSGLEPNVRIVTDVPRQAFIASLKQALA